MFVQELSKPGPLHSFAVPEAYWRALLHDNQFQAEPIKDVTGGTNYSNPGASGSPPRHEINFTKKKTTTSIVFFIYIYIQDYLLSSIIFFIQPVKQFSHHSKPNNWSKQKPLL